jgi:hypothetical protein
MSESEAVQYLGATFYVGQLDDGSWSAYYRGGGRRPDGSFDNSDRIGVIGESREEVIEAVKEHLDNWGNPVPVEKLFRKPRKRREM